MSAPPNTTPIEELENQPNIDRLMDELLEEEIEPEAVEKEIESSEPDAVEKEEEDIETPKEAVSPVPVESEPVVTSQESEEEVVDKEEVEDEEKKEIGEKTNPVIHLFGRKIDRDSVVVHFLIIVIWTLIWFGSGMATIVGKDIIFSVVFGLFILYNLASIMTAGHTSGGVVYELNILLTVEQMVAILFGTMVLFTLFYKNLPIQSSCAPVIFRLCISNVIILTLSSLWVSVWTSGRAFRSIRKFKQGIYNIALIVFIVIGILFLRQTCDKVSVPNITSKIVLT